MHFRVLGPLEVDGPAGPIAIVGRLWRAILALLVLHAGETLTTDRLIDELWGDQPPRGPQHAVEVHVSKLRGALGAEWIEAHAGGYRLRAEGSDIDLRRFEALMSEATGAFDRGNPAGSAVAFAAALGLWRGPRWRIWLQVTSFGGNAFGSMNSEP
jgi:DNA-binding SARP family transcriptional activator